MADYFAIIILHVQSIRPVDEAFAWEEEERARRLRLIEKVTLGNALELLMLKVRAETDAPSTRSGNPFQVASLMIVLTEPGDKTQTATVALAARFAQPLAVFSGVMLAFVIIDGGSIILAASVGKRLSTSKAKISAIIFIVLGILTFLGLL